MVKKIKNIGVLMGGFSSERDISLKSGTAVCQALNNVYGNIEIFDFKSEQELIEKLKNNPVDCVFNALHGFFGEDGQVQTILEDLEIVYTGSGPIASRLAMNKVRTHEILKKSGLRVPEYQVFNKDSVIDQGFYAEFPLVVKPAQEGSSIGLFIVDQPQALFSALKQTLLVNQDILIEKYIKGREITVGILDDNPLPVIEVLPKNKFYDFQAKYTTGMTDYIVPADLPLDVTIQAQAQAVKAHNLLGCRCFSRVDMIIDMHNNPIILEVNTIPGLTSTSLLPKAAKAVGIGFSELCQKMIFSAAKTGYEDTRVKVLTIKE